MGPAFISAIQKKQKITFTYSSKVHFTLTDHRKALMEGFEVLPGSTIEMTTIEICRGQIKGFGIRKSF